MRCKKLAAAALAAGALPVAHVDPISLGLLEAPGKYGCALAVGEGQSAGNARSYGGPHYGFLAARETFIRRMPGRIVGETTDLDGERGFVLTLQTREQHIRREKATSNMTTNQTLIALAGWLTLAFMVLPIIITASEEALKAVPKGYREGSLALGATKLQTILDRIALIDTRFEVLKRDAEIALLKVSVKLLVAADTTSISMP